MSVRRQFVRGGETVQVQAEALGDGRYRVRVGGRVHEYRAEPTRDGGVRMIDGADPAARAHLVYAAGGGGQTWVRFDGCTHLLRAPAARRGGGTAGDGQVRAPMTGTVLKVLCKPGDVVAADQTLVVVSAMKMEHKLTAGTAGIVERVDTSEGTQCEQGDVLAVVAAGAPKE